MQNKKFRWTEAEDVIIKTCYGHLPNKILQNKLPDRTINAIKHRAKKFGLTQKPKIHECNDLFFDIDTNESCYWAGFIAADGTILKSSNSLVVWLASKDREHLIKLKKSIDFTGPVADYNYGFPSSRIFVNSAKMIMILEEKFNITKKKSLTYCPPTRLNGERALAWIKGYIDGDGSIIPYKGKVKINVLGTKKTLTWIRKKYSYILGKKNTNKIAPRGNVFLLQIAGAPALKIFSYLKKIDTPFLKRKWNIN